MSKIKNIINGWQNFISKSEVSEDLVVQRAVHCVSCTELKKGVLLSMLKDDFVEIQGYSCNICNCPLSAKLRSEKETCPKKLW